jgi:VanZ family protein
LPRFRAAWLAFGWSLVVLVGVGSLLPSSHASVAGVSDKLTHFAAYFSLAFVFAGAVERARWLRIALGLLALGAGLEMAQGRLTTTRSAEWLDLAANAAGIAAGLLAARGVPGGWCRRVELAFGVGGAGR